MTAGAPLLELYDRALPRVYGYLVSRCGERAVAEDLTSETFLAAARSPGADPVTVAWLLGVARHKLADYWRAEERRIRTLSAVGSAWSEAEDPWEGEVDVIRARRALASVAPQHRAALTLRYLDGLSVPEVAEALQRTVHATEALLVRARRQLRSVYGEEVGDEV